LRTSYFQGKRQFVCWRANGASAQCTRVRPNHPVQTRSPRRRGLTDVRASTAARADTTTESGSPMYTGSCHCGAVRITLPFKPEVATACNCSLCRRIGGPWVYFESAQSRSRATRRPPPSTSRETRRCALFTAERVHASRIGSRCSQRPARSKE
jgi:hypothetical protein